MGHARTGMDRIDHLVYAAPDLEAGVNKIESLTGVRAAVGGSHPGMGTRNALVSLGPDVYLEIIAPDPAQADYRSPRLFRVDEADVPQLTTWAAKSDDVAAIASASLPDGSAPGSPMAGSRITPDGATLTWELTDPYIEIAAGAVPFFINWGASPHPARSAPGGVTLAGFRIEHPAADFVRAALGALGLHVPVDEEPQVALIAIIDTPRGQIELR